MIERMKWFELLAILVKRAGGTAAAARAMGNEKFQGNLHKLTKGKVSSPERATAERIAAYFEIPIEAIYSDEVATRVAAERGLLAGAGLTPMSPEEADSLPDDSKVSRVRRTTLPALAKAELLRGLMVIKAEEDLPPDIIRGYDVYLDFDRREPKDGMVVVAKTTGGRCFLGHYRKTVSGFEVDIGRGSTIDEARHGAELLGIATETRKLLAQ